MDSKTRVIHCGIDKDPFTGASSVPVYHASTFHRPDMDAPGAYSYVRGGNPTRAALEQAVAELEGGHAAFAFSSGMAAISSVFMIFAPGDHLVVTEDIYGGTFRALTTMFARWGLTTTFVDASRPECIEQAITPDTKAIYVETPSNPLLKITDLRAVAAIARKRGLLTIIDNTFCTPYLQRPIEFGYDIVLHSATKFLNGHSDVLAGLAVARTPETAERLYTVQNGFGAVLGVQDSWLLLRGMRTLAVRMDAAQANAAILAHSLAELPGVHQVYYPTLAGHPGRDIHLSQASGGGAVISFELKDKEAVKTFLRSVRLPFVGVSLGGVEGLLSYPAMMSHASMPAKERERLGISDALIRFSVGLESPADILDDFRQALEVCSSLAGKGGILLP